MTTESPGATERARSRLFRDVVEAVERSGRALCVLRGYRGYPEHIGPDVDAISDDPARLPGILAREGTATVVRVFEHGTTFYSLCRWEDGRPIFVTFDLSRDYAHEGRLFFRGEEFLESSRPFKFFRVPSSEMEFASYLIRRVAQGSLAESQGRRLNELFLENPAGSTRLLARLFSEAEVALLAGAARSGEWEPVRGRIGHLRRVMFGRQDREHPLGLPRYWAGVLWRRIERIVHPPGLAVAFLGTDGAGKSTIMTRVEQDLGPAFWEKRQYHKRPLSSPFRWLRRYGVRPPGASKRRGANEGGASGFNPHALPDRGTAYSLAKLGFWWADFVFLAYAAEIFPKLTRPALLLFDRYYHDLLVDPRRYHYGGSMRMARVVSRFVPRPHLIFILDAPPEVLHARKQELPFGEVIRQREAYLELARSLSNGHIIDTTRPLDEAAEEVERIILDYMAEHASRRETGT